MTQTTHSFPTMNPFTLTAAHDAAAFYGRQEAIKHFQEILHSEEPSSRSIVGDNYIGKTSLLRYLSDPKRGLVRQDPNNQSRLVVYFDASPYSDLATDDNASLYFWWDMQQALLQSIEKLRGESAKKGLPPVTGINTSISPVDAALEYKNMCEELLRAQYERQQKRSIIMLDNFEGVASLSARDSSWLRNLTRYCVYITASRYPLILLYPPEKWSKSPIWNVFDPRVIILGLLEEDEADSFLYQGEMLRGFWREEDIATIRAKAGRHPAFLRMFCERMYRKRAEANRQQQSRKLNAGEIDLLAFSFYKEASTICNQLWHGLADPELMGFSRPPDDQGESKMPSVHQRALMDVIQRGTADTELLVSLRDRGLIEYKNGKWCVFADVMGQFVSRLAQLQGWTNFPPDQNISSTNPSTLPAQNGFSSNEDTASTNNTQENNEAREPSQQKASTLTRQGLELQTFAFSYLEGEVYSYLEAHANEVCDKNDIKKAIWKKKEPADSTLQKLIERIRKKIEPDPENPRYLIAVRGQGYILRLNQPQAISD